MVDCVHGRNVCQQCLGRADIAGGLVSSDVLLPGLQSQAVAVVATSIPRDVSMSEIPSCNSIKHLLCNSNHPARHQSGVFFLASKESCMGPTVE